MRRIAIVGLGKWGKNLVREFSKVSNVTTCHNTGNVENRIWLKKNFPKIKFAKSLQEILSNKSIDAVVIASPIRTHFPLSYQAILAGKHLFIEKTLAENSRDASKLIAMAKKNKLVLFVGHIFLYHPILYKIKAIAKNDPITYLKLSWVKTGTFEEDILLDLVSHFISIIIELLGIPKGIRVFDAKKVVSQSYDIITIEFQFDKGKKCVIDVNRASNLKKRSITIITKRNTFQWEDDALYRFNKKRQDFDLMFRPTETPLEIECKAFIQNLNNGTDYSNADKALKIVQLVENCKNMIRK